MMARAGKTNLEREVLVSVCAGPVSARFFREFSAGTEPVYVRGEQTPGVAEW